MARTLAALLLSLAVALASVTAVVARGQAPGMAITICTGTGPETVILGPDGQPARPHLTCPDCTAGLDPAPAPAPAATPAAPAPMATLPRIAASIVVPAARPRLHGARAPPLPA